MWQSGGRRGGLCFGLKKRVLSLIDTTNSRNDGQPERSGEVPEKAFWASSPPLALSTCVSVAEFFSIPSNLGVDYAAWGVGIFLVDIVPCCAMFFSRASLYIIITTSIEFCYRDEDTRSIHA